MSVMKYKLCGIREWCGMLDREVSSIDWYGV